jgi:hypothetical protein
MEPESRKSYAGYEPSEIVVTEAMMRDARSLSGEKATADASLLALVRGARAIRGGDCLLRSVRKLASTW